MAEPGSRSDLAALIERQMGECGPGPFEPDVRSASDLYLWAEIGRALRKAWSDLARLGATSEMEAAAQRLHRRMMGEAAAGAPLFPATAASPAREAPAREAGEA